MICTISIFLELVLADHAAHVATVAARFGAEAQRVRGHAQRQRVGFLDGVAHQVGQRHFGGGNQIALAVAHLGGEQVFLEFGQLAGAEHAVRVDDHRHVAFEIAVLAGLQVEHELRERAMQRAPAGRASR